MREQLEQLATMGPVEIKYYRTGQFRVEVDGVYTFNYFTGKFDIYFGKGDTVEEAVNDYFIFLTERMDKDAAIVSTEFDTYFYWNGARFVRSKTSIVTQHRESGLNV